MSRGYRAALLNFSKGEISPELEARFDLAAYQAAVRTARNVRVRRTGGLSKRIGTRFVAECLGSTAKLLPFQFSDEQGYALEFSQATMRPLALGGAVLEEELQVISITQAAQAVVEVNYHAYSVGEQVYFKNIEGMTEINDRWLTIVAVGDANHFTVDFNSTAAGAFTSSGGGTNRVGSPPPPDPAPVVPAPATPPPEPEIGSGSSGSYVIVNPDDPLTRRREWLGLIEDKIV